MSHRLTLSCGRAVRIRVSAIMWSRSPVIARRGALCSPAQTKLPPKESASAGRMRTRQPKHGTATQGRTKARDGTGHVSTVEFRLREVHSVVINDALFASLLGPLCTATIIRQPWRVCSQQRRAHLSAERWRALWQRLQVGTALSRIAPLSSIRGRLTPLVVICVPWPDTFSTPGPV